MFLIGSVTWASGWGTTPSGEMGVFWGGKTCVRLRGDMCELELLFVSVKVFLWRGCGRQQSTLKVQVNGKLSPHWHRTLHYVTSEVDYKCPICAVKKSGLGY